jgi:hypothetical protein
MFINELQVQMRRELSNTANTTNILDAITTKFVDMMMSHSHSQTL